MSPYQRAAAVAVATRPSPVGPTPVAAGRRWPGRGDRVSQAAIGFALAVVLAAMVCNRMGVAVEPGRSAPGVVDAAMRTWALDAVTVLALSAGAVVHSGVRRGRPGRWPVAVLGGAALASVVLVPGIPGTTG